MERYLIRRPGQPMDVANMALFLASDASSWITGQTYPVNGGFSSVKKLPLMEFMAFLLLIRVSGINTQTSHVYFGFSTINVFSALAPFASATIRYFPGRK